MASIPLLCNVCPKEPEFSDISHLLTHVASKGHLSQCHKAQIRGRQDATIREKLATYDRWYEDYQIEKLLSERMIAKESKDSNGRKASGNAKSSSAASVMAAKTRKRRAKNTVKEQSESPSPVKVEGNIDPQLSHAFRATSFNREASPFSPLDRVTLRSVDRASQYATIRHRAPVPRMDRWQSPATPPGAKASSLLTRAVVPSQPASDHRLETDSGSDYFRTFIRSPSHTIYPDPSELTALPPTVSSLTKPSKAPTRDELSDVGEASKPDTVQSTTLKGVKWPGMSLFDSASIDAQRRRNQKKDSSILEQMQQNSVSVEQIERIYWPNGRLKQQRLITGNVESSPVRESTPPSPLPKRQRTKGSKPVLKEISTNIPSKPRKTRARKANAAPRVGQSSRSQENSERLLTTPSPIRFKYPPTAHMGYNPPDDNDSEMRPMGRPRIGSRRPFDVYHDESHEHDEERSAYFSKDNQSLTKWGHGHQGLQHQSAANFTLPRKRSDKLPWDAQLRAFAGKSHRFVLEENSENIEPILDTAGRVEDAVGSISHERVTQRYFAVAGSQPSQFYSSMPPQMEFGGSFGSKYHGSTLNPLNASLRREHLPFYSHPPVSHLTSPQATGKRQRAEKHVQSESNTLARSRD